MAEHPLLGDWNRWKVKFERFQATFNVDQILILERRDKEWVCIWPAEHDLWLDGEDFPSPEELDSFPKEQGVYDLSQLNVFANYDIIGVRALILSSQGLDTWGVILALNKELTPWEDKAYQYFCDLREQIDFTITSYYKESLVVPQWFDIVMSTVPFSFTVFDLEQGKTTYTTDCLETFGMVTSKDVLSDINQLSRIVPIGDADNIQQFISKEMGQGTSFEKKFIQSIGNEARWVKCQVYFLKEESHHRPYWLISLWDMSEAKTTYEKMVGEYNENREAGVIKTKFLANVSHELRTPLNGIMGMLSLLLMDTHSPQEEEYLQMALHSAEGMLAMVQDLLDITRLDRDKVTLKTEPFNAVDLFQQSMNLHVNKAEQKGLVLDFEKDVDSPIFVGDAQRIKKIINNLLDNSIKFSNKGRIVLSLVLFNGHLSFSVKDQGIGMAPQTIKDIFTPFQQLEDPYTKRHEGLGIGLSIIKSLLNIMDGTINVESKEEEGSTFYIDIPPQESGYSKEQVLKEVDVPEFPSIKEILIAEDEIINRLYLKTVLHKNNYQVREARNGQEAVEMARLKKPDLIFMDIGMPVMNGLEAATQISKIYESHPIPIIALTAHVTVGESEEYKNSGMIGLISKPYDKRAVLKAIESVQLN
ncbi:ATP-binding response regulator [Spirochaeta cellobiosiphila]|uniref:ATP-binding response regulator n=1 Tax=Spirochaeta cellobiosiphila TaxID=504483 RepID=UPI0003FC20C9|nr:response regulator [Spirochaeta cellobiosiphila]